MATFTSCNFGTLDLGFRLRPMRSSILGGRIQVLDRLNSSTSSCFLCGEVLKRRRFKCFATSNGSGNQSEENDLSKDSNLVTISSDDSEDRRNSKEIDSEKPPATLSSRPPTISPIGPAYNNFQVDSFKLMELLGPEKVDPVDVKLIKDKLFGYSTFWVTKEEPFGDLGEGILFLGNLRGNREEVFAKLQKQLTEIMGDKYNLFMVEEPNSEGLDRLGGPRVSFGMLRKEVSEPGPTTLWQYVIALLLFVFTIGSSVELGIASQINQLPPEVVKYFTDPNAIEPPDMQLLYPYVESALPLAYGVLGVQLFHLSTTHYISHMRKHWPNTMPSSYAHTVSFLESKETKIADPMATPTIAALSPLSHHKYLQIINVIAKTRGGKPRSWSANYIFENSCQN